MSSEALAWAFKQDIKPSAVKFTLIALCECANYKTGHIFPSIKHLSEITGQNRKTIISNVQKLEQLGFIKDTGNRAGTTKQIKVYQAALETVPNTEQSQERNSSVYDVKESQKRDTEPSREPSKKKKDTNVSPKAKRDLKPDGLSNEIWMDWKSVRKKPVTATVLSRIRTEADKLGWTLAQAITEAAENSWQGFRADWVKEARKSNGKSQNRTVSATERVMERVASRPSSSGADERGRSDSRIGQMPEPVRSIGHVGR